MKDNISILSETTIKNKIFIFRDTQVMIDKDLAELFGTTTKAFNQAVKRNIDRFPEDFRFQLTKDEYNNLRSQNVTLSSNSTWGTHTKYLPYAFTEQGVSMLSAILKSDIAVETSIKIIREFVEMRKFISQNNYLFQRMELLEDKQKNTDQKVDEILNAIESKNATVKQGIFFEGQFFDAYIFISDILKQANKTITLIDNYIDEKIIYHIGASLKDLGNKWFAFSKLEDDNLELLKKVENILNGKTK